MEQELICRSGEWEPPMMQVLVQRSFSATSGPSSSGDIDSIDSLPRARLLTMVEALA